MGWGTMGWGTMGWGTMGWGTMLGEAWGCSIIFWFTWEDCIKFGCMFEVLITFGYIC